MSISQSEIFYTDHIFSECEESYMRIRDLREDHDYTQEYVASKLNIRQNTYSQYETGKRQLPIELLIQLADLYQTSTDYILCRTDNPIPYK
ncbi:MAG: helix-turn-helix transcriptional regulator [Ruminococcaceae bacterium]|nr:helix-turn-helix transcriptional regulator [Oscillospiraceae bacterium]